MWSALPSSGQSSNWFCPGEAVVVTNPYSQELGTVCVIREVFEKRLCVSPSSDPSAEVMYDFGRVKKFIRWGDGVKILGQKTEEKGMVMSVEDDVASVLSSTGEMLKVELFMLRVLPAAENGSEKKADETPVETKEKVPKMQEQVLSSPSSNESEKKKISSPHVRPSKKELLNLSPEKRIRRPRRKKLNGATLNISESIANGKRDLPNEPIAEPEVVEQEPEVRGSRSRTSAKKTRKIYSDQEDLDSAESEQNGDSENN